MCVMVLVGTAGLIRTLGWYFDPMRQYDRAGTIIAATRPSSRPSPSGATPRALPAATSEELALLRVSDAGVQLKGAEALLGRAVTPELVAAVDAALQTDLDPRVSQLLVCNKSRFEGPEILDYLIDRFPKTRRELDWNLKADVSCVLDALTERITDAPDRIVAALMPAAYASNHTTRRKVVEAFRLIDVRTIPAELVADATSGPARRNALAAAIALGALRTHPELIADALRDRETFHTAAEELRLNPDPAGARIIATAWTDRPFEPEIERLAVAREHTHHDVSAALLEIVRGPADDRKVVAVRHVAALAEVGALPELRQLTASVQGGELKVAIEAAIDTLQERRKVGLRDQMRALPQ